MSGYENAIEVKGLTKKYDGFTLDNVDITVPKGTIMGFVGQNGAGKTTTIRSLLNIITPDSGSISLFGMDLKENESAIKERLAVVFDELPFHDCLNADRLNKIMREIYSRWNSDTFYAYLDRFAEAGISICAQIVLCKGLNDGAELIRSMHDLTKYYPSLVSCSIVPAGLTKFREKLYPLSPYTGEECGEVIDTVEKYAAECYEKFGTHLFFCSDEFYIKSGRELPPESYYEGYPQIENGVGMITSLKTEVGEEMEYFDEYEERLGEKKRVVSIATGVAAYDCIKELAEKVASETGGRVTVHVYKIINRFFGENITVSGLLTATDMIKQLAGKELGDELLIPHNALKADEDIFLDDVTLDEFSKRLGGKVTPAKDSGAEFVSAVLGLE